MYNPEALLYFLTKILRLDHSIPMLNQTMHCISPLKAKKIGKRGKNIQQLE